MKRIMAVYDVDPLYADRFAEFTNEREKTPFTAVAFTSAEKLRQFAARHEVELLLVGENVPPEELEGVQAGQVVRLNGDGGRQDSWDTSVYKYQSTDAVLREVMACYQAGAEALPEALAGTAGRLIGVYSPVSRCGKTGFALTLGQYLARREKTLYLNFETCSGLSRLMGTSYRNTLSELLYYRRLGEYSRVKLETAVYSWGELDYVPPAAYAEDLADVKGEELAGLAAQIAADGRYRTLILDIGGLGRHAEPLLELCETVYTPVREDCVSAAKLEEWRQYLLRSGRGKLLNRVQTLRLPAPRGILQPETWLEGLVWGSMGEFVHRLLSGEDGGVSH